MWQPEDESLKMLVELLNESQVPDNAKQAEIHNVITLHLIFDKFLENHRTQCQS